MTAACDKSTPPPCSCSWWGFAPRQKTIRLDIMVGEDLTVRTSPDVVFHLALTVKYARV